MPLNSSSGKSSASSNNEALVALKSRDTSSSTLISSTSSSSESNSTTGAGGSCFRTFFSFRTCSFLASLTPFSFALDLLGLSLLNFLGKDSSNVGTGPCFFFRFWPLIPIVEASSRGTCACEGEICADQQKFTVTNLIGPWTWAVRILLRPQHREFRLHQKSY